MISIPHQERVFPKLSDYSLQAQGFLWESEFENEMELAQSLLQLLWTINEQPKDIWKVLYPSKSKLGCRDGGR